MSKGEKVMACYQHACLLYENGEALTNQSLRERHSIGKNNAAVASRIISDAIAAGLIKAQEGQSASTKFWGYVPYYV